MDQDSELKDVNENIQNSDDSARVNSDAEKMELEAAEPKTAANKENKLQNTASEKDDDSNRYSSGGKKDWFILKVQVNREESIKKRLENRIQQTGLERYFDGIIVPTEKVVTRTKRGTRIVNHKLYPGYIMVNMEINDDTWFLVRETAGIGDFTGAAGKPVPMLPHEVQRILNAGKVEEEAPKLKVPFEVGDIVKINDGTFKDIEGEVSAIDEVTGRITVIITIFARSTPVELEYWQVEKAA